MFSSGLDVPASAILTNTERYLLGTSKVIASHPHCKRGGKVAGWSPGSAPGSVFRTRASSINRPPRPRAWARARKFLRGYFFLSDSSKPSPTTRTRRDVAASGTRSVLVLPFSFGRRQVGSSLDCLQEIIELKVSISCPLCWHAMM